MGCGASTSKQPSCVEGSKSAPSPVVPEETSKPRVASPDLNSSITTAATLEENKGVPPGEAEDPDPEEEDSFNTELAPKPPAQDEDVPDRYYKRERRVSHSSESTNPNNVEVVTHPKTDDEKSEIQKYLLESTNFLFKGLTDVRAGMVASAMFKKEAKAGEIVIKQGDDGDNFYLISSGEMEVLVQRDPSSEPAKVLEYSAGGTFGELALMYLCPRAATVKATSDCVLWCLDRVQFRALMCGAEQQEANSQWEPFLEHVEVLSTLNKFERMTLANELEEEDCGKDEYVIEQGDEDAEFLYILEAGSCVAILDPEDGTDPMTVKDYVPGDYFGEIALLEGAPRKAYVKVTSDEAHFLKISAETFKRLLGPVHDVMQKNAALYKKDHLVQKHDEEDQVLMGLVGAES